MGKFDAAAATALRIIKAKGSKVTLSRVAEASFDPVTEERVTSTVSGDFWVVEIPPGRSAEFKIGSLVNRNVRQFYMARKGVTMEPQAGDTLTWGGEVYALIPPLTHYDPAGDGACLTVAYAER